MTKLRLLALATVSFLAACASSRAAPARPDLSSGVLKSANSDSAPLGTMLLDTVPLDSAALGFAAFAEPDTGIGALATPRKTDSIFTAELAAMTPSRTGFVTPPIPQRQTASGFPYSNGHIGAFYAPIVVIDIDEDKIDPASPPPDIESSSGWGAVLGRWEDSLGMDIVFQTSKHDEKRTGAKVRLSSLYIDMTTRGLFWPGTFSGWGAVSLGGGVGQIDWDRTYRDKLTGHWQAKAMFAVQATNWFEMDVAIALFALAHPGNTVGSGGLVTLGGAFHF